MLSKNAIQNIQAILVLVCPVLAWIFIPAEILVPVAWVTLAVTVGSVFAIKAYMKKLKSESRLAGPDRLFYIEVAMALAIVGLGAFFVLLVEYA